MDYLSNKSSTETIETFLSDGNSAYEDIAQYYADAGYTIDPNNGKFLSPPVVEDETKDEENQDVSETIEQEQNIEPFDFGKPSKQNMVDSDGDIMA